MTRSRDISRMIDHSLLRPELTRDQIIEGCKIAKKYEVPSVCVRLCDIVTAKEELRGSNIRVETVIGYPNGMHSTEVKVFEAKKAIEDGADELDMVLNMDKLLLKDYYYVACDIKGVLDVAHEKKIRLKVIFENSNLSEEFRNAVYIISERIGADYVKSLSSFGAEGVTIGDLEFMNNTYGDGLRIKAGGGFITLEGALEIRNVSVIKFEEL